MAVLADVRRFVRFLPVLVAAAAVAEIAGSILSLVTVPSGSAAACCSGSCMTG
jgi:hypothetical protein